MAVVDRQGRLFGKFNLLDIGAALVILAVVVGLIFGTTATTTAITGGKPIEMDVLVMGLSASNPKGLIQQGQKTNFIIRNQPYGEVDVKAVEYLTRTVTVSQPDGTVKALDDPRPEMKFSNNLKLTLVGNGEETAKGFVLGNSDIKVGTPVELQGKTYSFKASVLDVRDGQA
jgi:hypothetical protein